MHNRGPEIAAVGTDPRPPASADVVVIGGGIAGVSTALALAERGVSVVLCEKGQLAGEQSSRNWGWVRNMGRDPRELPLMVESMRLWQELDARLAGGLGFRRCGIVYLCEDDATLAKRTAWLEHARPFQLDTRVIDGDEIAAVLPGVRPGWKGALYTKSDARAEPQLAVPGLARLVRERGGKVVTGCAVRGIETRAGRIAGVVTEHGPIACSSVVLAGGAWSRLFCRNLGVTLPQLKVLASVMRVDGVADGPDSSAAGPGFGFRKRLDGGYNVASTHTTADIVPDSFRFFFEFLPALRLERPRLRFGKRYIEEARLPSSWRLDEVSPFEQVRILDPEPAQRELDASLARLRDAYPAFAAATVRQRWGGLIDATPDAIPVISPVDALPGFFIATGFSGHGFGIGPGAGRLMADLVTGAPPLVDPAPFRFRRFTDGARPRPTTGV